MQREFRKGRLFNLKSTSVFAAAAALLSALILVLSLVTAAETARLNDSAAEYERKIESIQTENARLEARLNMSCSLEEIERYALDVLGMQHVRPEQIVILP